MASHLEVELKWALDADGHARLGAALAAELGPPHLLEQRNRFLDSADLRLRRAGLNLRLRRENGRLLMTCKRRVADPAGGAGDLHRHDEWEEWLDPVLWDAPPAACAAQLQLPEPHRTALAGAALVDLGGFANARAEFHARRAGVDDLLCLDRTDFNGRRTDHELEIETADPAGAAAHWAGRLAAWGIAWRAESRTKFARFLAVMADGGRA
jgi:uncharacterized protein YjbK